MSPLYKRTRTTGNFAIDQELDRISEQMRALESMGKIGQSSKSLATSSTTVIENPDGSETIYNNSGAAMEAYCFYSVGSNGNYTAAGSLSPQFQVTKNVPDKSEGPILRGGLSRVKLADTTESVSKGGDVWLTSSGKVTGTQPSGGTRYKIGQFASDRVDSDGTVEAWVAPATHYADHTSLTNIGTNTHPQIDSALSDAADHIADTSTAHGGIVRDHTELENIGTNTHAEIDTAVSNSEGHIAEETTAHGLTLADILLVDGSRVAQKIIADNLQLDGNTISSVNANGNIILSPNGTGMVGIGVSPESLLTVQPLKFNSRVEGLKFVNSVSTNDAILQALMNDANGISLLLGSNMYFSTGAAFAAYLSSKPSSGVYASYNGDIRFFTAGAGVSPTVRLFISDVGKHGFMTSTPQEIGHIVGNLTVTGSIKTGGNSSTAGTERIDASGNWQGVTIPITKGGTGQTTAQAAIDALLPSQSGNSGEFLTTDGSNASWGEPTALAIYVGGYAISGS